MCNKLTPEEVLIQFKEVHGEQYDYSELEYINSKTKVKIICREHGEFLQLPSKHKSGSGCPYCGKSKQLNTEIFIDRSKKRFPNKFTYENTNYSKNYNECSITCVEHGDFKITPNNHLSPKSKGGCKKCQYEKLKNKCDFKEFCKLSSDKFGNKFHHEEIEKFVNKSCRITIFCDCGEIWDTTGTNHLTSSNGGCKNCQYLKLNELFKYDVDQFKRDCDQVHDDYYDYDLVNFSNLNDTIHIKCPKHGIFEQRAYNHRNGNGCIPCRQSKYETKIKDYLDSNNFQFVFQKRFNTCKYKNTLPFDFYIESHNLLIEMQGEQHYRPVKYWGGEDAFILQKIKDQIKRDWCKENNINLLEIKYNQNIEEELKKIF